MAKFKVLGGSHIEGRNKDGSFRRYRQGDVVDSATDLAHRFNCPNSVKFERMPDDTPDSHSESTTPVPDDGLDGLTVVELKQLADEQSVNLDGCTNKSQILKAVRAAGLTV